MRSISASRLGWWWLLVLVCAAPLQAQQDFDKVNIETVRVADGLYMLVGSGGNLGVSVGNDGVFLIDDQYAELSPKILAAIHQLSDKPIRFLLNTHWHMDHTGGNQNMAATGAIIVAQNNVRTRMQAGQFMKFMDRKVEPAPTAALPIVSFSDEISFFWNGQQIHAFHVANAHTDGDTIIHFPDRDTFHMGDTYFNGLYPFIDQDSGGTVAGVIAAVDRVLAVAHPATMIIPGHGPLSNVAELRAYREMLATVTKNISAQIAAGKTREAVIAAKPTAAFDATFGKVPFIPPDKWVGMLFDLLSAPAG